MTKRISAARYVPTDVLVLVGTTKGAFIFTSNASRTRWRADGPHFPGEAVYSLAFDQRGGRFRLTGNGCGRTMELFVILVNARTHSARGGRPGLRSR